MSTKNNKIRLLSLLLAVMLLAGLASGCTVTPSATQAPTSPSGTPAGQGGGASSQPADTAAAGPEDPYAEHLTIRVYAVTDDNVEGDVPQAIAEMFNFTFDFDVAPKANPDEKFNLLIASGELPDFMINGVDDIYNYVEKGAFVSIDDFVDGGKVDSLKKMIEENESWRYDLSYNDGKLYYFPTIAASRTSSTYIVNELWLTKTGLSAPVTLDDWTQMLTAFRDSDINGNGIADEVPFTIPGGNWRNIDFYESFGIDREFFVEDGEIKYGPYDERMLEYLEYANMLYTERLIDQEYISLNSDISRGKLTNNTAGSTYDSVSGIGKVNNVVDRSTGHKLIAVAPPATADGTVYTRHQQDKLSLARGGAITSQASPAVVERILAWMNFVYTDEGSLLCGLGVEGKHWDYIDGVPTVSDFIMKNPDGISVSDVLGDAFINQGWPMRVHPIYEQSTVEPEVNDGRALYEPLIISAFPRLKFTGEEQSAITSAMAEATTIVDEYINKFIMGTLPLSDFDSYIAMLQRVEIDKVLEYYNASYQRLLAE